MIHLNDLSVQFGGRYLFRNVALHVRPADRIGLVGPNGAGKTTLMKIIAGLEQPESGQIRRAPLVAVGYLPQEQLVHRGRTLVEEARAAFAELVEAEKEMEAIRRRLEGDPAGNVEQEQLLVRLGELQHRFEHEGGFSMDARVEQVLAGLGFAQGDFSRPVETFSGGWQMRIALAKHLLRQPEVLLLDEPTNHLDLDSLQWLESYLDRYPGALMVVSHDRAFLDKLAQRIVEISRGNLDTYAGNYSQYEVQKVLRKEQQIAAFRGQQQKIRETEAFIDRFRYKATKARQVQSRIKQLEKMERVELENDSKAIRFRFPQSPRSGRVVVELKSVTKRYAQNTALHEVNFVLQRGERVAVVGVNGAGKSTLARIVAGIEPVSEGQRLSGHNVIPAYFAQQQADELDGSRTVLETVEEVSPEEFRPRLRSLLGGFLFSGDDVEKKVSVLSGGEKSRLALARMLLIPANLLVLDEPTNHLDMDSKEVLHDALAAFEGSLLIVSHDRAFLGGLVDGVVEADKGRLRFFPGDLNAYLSQKKADASRFDGKANSEAVAERSSAAADRKEQKRREAEERQRRYRLLRPLQERIAAVEEKIHGAEERQQELERRLSDDSLYGNPEHAREVSWQYRETEEEIAAWMVEWERLHAELEETERGLG